MCLAVVREDVFHFVVHLQTVLAASLGHDVDAAERLDGASQQFVGLQADNQFILFVDIAGLVGRDGGYCGIVQGADTVVVSLFLERFQTDVPNAFGTFRWSLQERGIPCVGGDVLADKVSHVDFFAPKPVNEDLVQFHNSCGF